MLTVKQWLQGDSSITQNYNASEGGILISLEPIFCTSVVIMLLLMCMFVLIWSFERLKSDPFGIWRGKGRDLMPGGRYNRLSLFTLHNNNGLKTSLYGETKFFINGCSSRTVKHAAIWVNHCFSTRKCLHDSDWLNLGQDVTWNPAGEQHKPIRHRSSSH